MTCQALPFSLLGFFKWHNFLLSYYPICSIMSGDREIIETIVTHLQIKQSEYETLPSGFESFVKVDLSEVAVIRSRPVDIAFYRELYNSVGDIVCFH